MCDNQKSKKNRNHLLKLARMYRNKQFLYMSKDEMLLGWYVNDFQALWGMRHQTKYSAKFGRKINRDRLRRYLNKIKELKKEVFLDT